MPNHGFASRFMLSTASGLGGQDRATPSKNASNLQCHTACLPCGALLLGKSFRCVSHT